MKLEAIVRIVFDYQLGWQDKIQPNMLQVVEIFEMDHFYARPQYPHGWIKDEIQCGCEEEALEACLPEDLDKEQVYEMIAEFWGETQSSNTIDGYEEEFYWEFRNCNIRQVCEEAYKELGLITPLDSSEEPPNV